MNRVVNGCDPAYHFSVFPVYSKEIDLPVLAKGIPLRIQFAAHIKPQGWNPFPIIPVNLPRKLDEFPKVSFILDL